VIVPVRNEAAALHELLACVLAGSYPADRFEVVVADGGSTDGTRTVLDAWTVRDKRVRRVDNPSGSTPAGLNAALAAATGEIVVRLDAHAEPASDYLERCVDALGATGAAAVGGHLNPVGRTQFSRAVALAMASPFGGGPAAFRQHGEGPVDTVYMGAWHREVLEAVGGFDEGWARNQDYELNVRLRAIGGLVWLDPAIRSRTRVRESPVGLFRQYFGYGSGRAATVRRHPGSLRARQAVPAAFTAVLLVLGVMASALAGARRALRALLGLYAGACLIAARARVGPGRPATTGTVAGAFALMHVAWGLGFWSAVLRAIVAERRRPLDTESTDG
jgi:glycosyltransferase involved in cell wall biosynthesis